MKIVLKKNKTIGKIWHPETRLVFKSPSEKIVIGYFNDEEVIKLNEENIKVCKEWGFKFEPLGSGDGDEGDGDEGDGDEDGDEDGDGDGDGDGDEDGVEDEDDIGDGGDGGDVFNPREGLKKLEEYIDHLEKSHKIIEEKYMKLTLKFNKMRELFD